MLASIMSSGFYINCQPMVPPDPVIGSFTALYDNTNGATPALATVTNASITMTHPNTQTLVWSFSVNPTISGNVPAGVSQSQAHQKVSNSGTGIGTGAPCNYCNGTWVLNVTWDIGGQATSDTLSLNGVQCAF